MESKSDQFPKDTSNILVIDISKSSGTTIFDFILSLKKIIYVKTNINEVTPLTTSNDVLKPADISRISTLMCYDRKVRSEYALRRELQIINISTSKHPVPNSILKVFDENNLYGGSFTFELNSTGEF